MERAKITLSEQEHRLMMDPSVILTKNRVIEKIYELFGHCSSDCLSMLMLPPEVAAIHPKIAKGEAYRGLPYVMLDYPRYFTSNDVLAIRTFFWWGNYVSVTLHLKGRYLSIFGRSILERYAELVDQQWAVSIGEDEWDHDLNGGGYLFLAQMDKKRLEDQLLNGVFVKLSCSFSLKSWDKIPDQLRHAYEQLNTVMRFNEV